MTGVGRIRSRLVGATVNRSGIEIKSSIGMVAGKEKGCCKDPLRKGSATIVN